MRSGFVAGDAADPRALSALPHLPWLRDERSGQRGEHRRVARRGARRRETAGSIARKFEPRSDPEPVAGRDMPDAAFYLWAHTPIPTRVHARLYEAQAVSVLPGSYLARESGGINPGTDRVRIALVSSTKECAESARRIRDYVKTL
jgi:aspartate/methionine/tyrosine aminotransferase